ncbi:hypothetical protein IIA29_08565, partial [candidate division KSB1 bacterium]|nr:hypothetical protein [candidate division KSB1 bacterium]
MKRIDDMLIIDALRTTGNAKPDAFRGDFNLRIMTKKVKQNASGLHFLHLAKSQHNEIRYLPYGGIMKITDIEAIVLAWPPPEKPFWTALRPIGRVNELLVRVHTDNGIVGIGEAHSAGMGFPGIYRENAKGEIEAAGAAKLVVEVLKPLLMGEDPRDNERLWDKMFRLNHEIGWATTGWGRPQIMTGIAGVDIALWDIKGKAANMPVYKLLGGTRDTVPC